jgi:hypothetical protein
MVSRLRVCSRQRASFLQNNKRLFSFTCYNFGPALRKRLFGFTHFINYCLGRLVKVVRLSAIEEDQGNSDLIFHRTGRRDCSSSVLGTSCRPSVQLNSVDRAQRKIEIARRKRLSEAKQMGHGEMAAYLGVLMFIPQIFRALAALLREFVKFVKAVVAAVEQLAHLRKSPATTAATTPDPTRARRRARTRRRSPVGLEPLPRTPHQLNFNWGTETYVCGRLFVRQVQFSDMFLTCFSCGLLPRRVLGVQRRQVGWKLSGVFQDQTNFVIKTMNVSFVVGRMSPPFHPASGVSQFMASQVVRALVFAPTPSVA